MTKPKKLIEVAMPIKEISAESVRDKYIHHGHISTLHIWWARRPLPVCRAVIFASLVPDPLDENCPTQFKEAVEILLGKDNDLPGDPYKPYDDIPHTAIVDKMEDNLRNRLMMFIGKFSNKYVKNEKKGSKTAPKDLMNQFSLISWHNKNEDKIIGRAKQLIFISYNAAGGKSASKLLTEYKRLNDQIKIAEQNLYLYENRHLNSNEASKLEKEKDEAIASFLSKMPKVFDPFAGGGAIPLEASRLGCNSYGNDINPVAHIIQKGSCEFPQKYGKPITYSIDEFQRIYGALELKKQYSKNSVFGNKVKIINRLAHDVEHYALEILRDVDEKVGHLYPVGKSGERPLVYYWTRVGTCSNPTCGAKVPLLKQFYLCKKPNKHIYLEPIINGSKIDFKIQEGKTELNGWLKRGNLICPCCGNTTDIKTLKKQFINGTVSEKLIAIVWGGKQGKEYRLPDSIDLEIQIERLSTEQSKMQIGNKRNFNTPGWGFDDFNQMFSNRQLLVMHTFVEELNLLKVKLNSNQNEYAKAVVTYLVIWINRIVSYNTSFGRWIPQNQQLTSVFGRQAIPMIFDYPEMQPFADSTSAAKNQLEWIIRFLHEENFTFYSHLNNSASGEKNQFDKNELDAVITDPPYYDAIAYADLSDFFYVWMKQNIADLYPLNFATPQTPKREECTALKHHHDNDTEKAFNHFDVKLLKIFQALEHQTKDLISIMFAHQSTSAWTTLCTSILGAGLNISGSWAIDSERDSRMTANSGNALQSSVTVSCIPFKKSGIGNYKDVKKELLQIIRHEVSALYALGFRGADLLTACFGKAVSVFGKYESVEKADGSLVTVAELLEMAREAAFDAIISDIDTDDLTKFYIGWLNLFGFSEANHDDVRRISQIGLSVDISDIYSQNILIKDDDKGVLGSVNTRIREDSKLGLRPVNNTCIDIAHRLMYLFDPNNGTRAELLDYISEKAPNSQSVVWRVLNSLAELLPKSKDMKDHELATGLLSNQENLLREAKNREETSGIQSSIDFE